MLPEIWVRNLKNHAIGFYLHQFHGVICVQFLQPQKITYALQNIKTDSDFHILTP